MVEVLGYIDDLIAIFSEVNIEQNKDYVENNLISAYKDVLSFGLSLESYSWNQLQEIKDVIGCIEIYGTCSLKKDPTGLLKRYRDDKPRKQKHIGFEGM